MNRPKIPYCENCKFVSGSTSRGSAECKRYPPVPILLERAFTPQAYFPKVASHDWCGEHQFRENVA